MNKLQIGSVRSVRRNRSGNAIKYIPITQSDRKTITINYLLTEALSFWCVSSTVLCQSVIDTSLPTPLSYYVLRIGNPYACAD